MWKRFGLLTQSLGTDDMLSTDMPFSEVDLQIVVEAFKFPVDAADVMPDMDDADAMLTWLTKAPRGHAGPTYVHVRLCRTFFTRTTVPPALLVRPCAGPHKTG